MSIFKYKLQPVLDIKEKIEINLKNELGRTTQRLEQEKNILNNMVDEKNRHILSLCKQMQKGITVGNLREHNSYIWRMGERVRSQQDNIQCIKNEVDQCREQLIKAVKEKKTLQNLKNKKFAEFQKEQLSEEQKRIDEIISFNHKKQLVGD